MIKELYQCRRSLLPIIKLVLTGRAKLKGLAEGPWIIIPVGGDSRDYYDVEFHSGKWNLTVNTWVETYSPSIVLELVEELKIDSNMVRHNMSDHVILETLGLV